MSDSIYILEARGVYDDNFRALRLRVTKDEWRALLGVAEKWGNMIVYLTDPGYAPHEVASMVGAMERALIPPEPEPEPEPRKSPKRVKQPAKVYKTANERRRAPIEPIPKPAPRPLCISQEQEAAVRRALPFLRDKCKRGLRVVRQPG